jgi:hypothetical protein
MKYIKNTLIVIMSLVTAVSICSCKKEAHLEDYVTNADTVYTEISHNFELDYVSTSQFEDHGPSYDLYERSVSSELESTGTGIYEISLIYRDGGKEVQIEVNCEDHVAQSIDTHDPVIGDKHEEIFENLPTPVEYEVIEDTLVYDGSRLEIEESISAGTIIEVDAINNSYARYSYQQVISLDDIRQVND